MSEKKNSYQKIKEDPEKLESYKEYQRIYRENAKANGVVYESRINQYEKNKEKVKAAVLKNYHNKKNDEEFKQKRRDYAREYRKKMKENLLKINEHKYPNNLEQEEYLIQGNIKSI